MRNKIVYIVFFVYILGCTETEYPHKFPLVVTDEVTNISSSGTEFSGRLMNVAGHKILSHGFVWALEADPTLNSSKISLTTNVADGKFSEVVKSDLVANEVYQVRAFIQTDKLTIYGESKLFNSKGSLAPAIHGFSPDEGIDGTEITIAGENFSTRAGGNKVTIGDAECEILSFAENELTVRLPLCDLVGPFHFNVEVSNQTGSSSTPFVIIGPLIKSISASSGRVGDLITISGENFNLAHYMEVTIGEPSYGQFTSNLSTVDKVSDGTGNFRVPNFAGNTGNVQLHSSLTVEGYKSHKSSLEFTVVDSWQQRSASSPVQDYQGFTSAQINNTVFVLGGRSLYAYDLVARTWSQKADFPGAYRFYATAFANKGKLFYGFGAGYHEPNGGGNWQYYSDLWQYDPMTNSWTSLGNSPMTGRFNAVALEVANKIYIGFGGIGDPTPSKYGDLWEYNVSDNSWTEINTSAVQGNFTGGPLAFSAGGKGYFLELHYASQPYTSVLWEFDPVLSTWTRRADLHDWVTRGPVATMTGHGLVICDANSVPRVYEYDPLNDVWITRQTLQSHIAPLKFIGVSGNIVHLGGKEVWEMSFD
jgi:hypothetical protein